MSRRKVTRHTRAVHVLTGRSVPVVALGASAGGLETVQAVLAKLPPDSGMAFVVIQHLDPARPSALASLLSKSTSMPVVEISKRIAVQPNQVYVVPPNKRASIRDGTLSLRPIQSQDRRHPVDDFMADLAATQGDAAIGVVLSGMGLDGTQGLAAIKAAGGITFAQDPKTAQWPAMPLSAMEAGFADFVLPPKRIALELGRIGRYAYKSPQPPEELDEILQILRGSTGIDFRHYRQSTVARRVLRQMGLKGVGTLAQFARLLRRDRKETESLADQVFVPFTGFFRDPDNLVALRRCIRSRLLRKRRTEPLRVWAAGCSTGEEVYSLAMLLAEELGTAANRTAVQIFGTDIRERAIQHARAGVYTQAAVEGVTPARLKRFFVKSDGGYRINRALRDLCAFAQHDLTKDPPFSSLDLISCRNVLAYLKPAFQDQILKAFHYALKPGAFLYTDGSLAAKAPYFAVTDREHGIFSRRRDAPKAVGGARTIALPSRKQSGANAAAVTSRAAWVAANEGLSAANEELETANEELRASNQEIVALGEDLRNRNATLTALASDLGALLTGVDVPVVVLDSRRRIVRFTSAAATLFQLDSSHEGVPFIRAASNLGDLSWKTLLAQVTRHGQIVERTFQHRNGRWYSLRMKPFGESVRAVSGVLVVLLDENVVRRALLETRGSLAESESTVRALLDAPPQAIFAVNAGGRIVWANRTTASMFGYELPELLGQPLDLLVPEPHRTRHAAHYLEFFANPRSRPMGIGLELQGRRRDGSLFPVEIGLGAIETRTEKLGVAFVADITETKRTEQALREHQQSRAVLFDSSPDALLRFDSNLRATHVNPAFEQVTGIARKDVLGKTGSELPIPRDMVDRTDALVRAIFKTGQPKTIQSSYPTPQGVREFEVRYIPELAADQSVTAVFSIARDITEQSVAEQALRQREQELATLFDNSPDVIVRLDRNLRYLYLNAEWERATGISRDKAIGNTAQELGMPPHVIKLQERSLRKILKTQRPLTFEFTYPSQDGQRDREARLIPEFSDGRLASILVIGRDITEQRRLQTLAAANARDIRALTASLMTAQEHERRRVARDIHDSLGQQLGVLAAEIRDAAGDLSASSPAAQRLRAVRTHALRIIEDARHIARQLHPAILEDLGLSKALENLCHEFGQQEGIPVSFRLRGPLPPIPLEAASCAYRVAQEALHNIAKHARAKHASVLLIANRSLGLSIRDDGAGFDPAAVRGSAGLGLIGMKERARIAGGKLGVKAVSGRGVRLHLVIPLAREVKFK